MSLETKRIKELFGYARTLTKEQGVGVMAARAAGFFKRRFFGKKARYLPAKQRGCTGRYNGKRVAKTESSSSARLRLRPERCIFYHDLYASA